MVNITGPHDARLTLKQQRFISEYLIDGNASGAYQRSGFRSTGNTAEVCAYQLLRKPQVKIALDEARRQLSEVTSLDAQWVDERLMSVVESCCEPVPILDRQGQPTGRFTFDSMGALKGLELLAKRLRLFSSEEPQPGAPEQPLSLNLPPEILSAWAARIRAQQERGVPPDDPPAFVPPPDDAPPENAPPPAPSLQTDRAQIQAKLLSESRQPPRPCEHCGVLFRPQRTEKHCCYACLCRAQGKTHRVQGHTADCRRCRSVSA